LRKIADAETVESTLDPTFEVVQETRARRLRKKQVGSKDESFGQDLEDEEPIIARQAKKKAT